MHSFPSVPPVDDAPDELLDSGHLWLLEAMAGAPLRFRLLESGLIEFGDADRVYDSPEDLPPQYNHVVRHIRERLDREALRAALDDVEAIVFFGQAMQYRGVGYDWERTPSFLGTEIWSADTGGFRPPDAVDGIFDRLGLDAVNPIQQEVRARDFDPDSYTIPDSAWYDGPAEGVVIRNKTGGRATLVHPDFRDNEGPEPFEASAEEIAERYATDRRFEKIATEIRTRDGAVSFDALYERTLEEIVRETHGRLFHDSSSVDIPELRSAVSARTGTFLSTFDG
jgi:hypothetical protein